jgi:hypothetical protein
MIMEQDNTSGGVDRDTIYLMGGLALMVLGAGLVASHPTVRKAVTGAVASVLPDLQGKFGPDLSSVGSDLQRYMKLRSM